MPQATKNWVLTLLRSGDWRMSSRLEKILEDKEDKGDKEDNEKN
jgi:hypothetical protein